MSPRLRRTPCRTSPPYRGRRDKHQTIPTVVGIAALLLGLLLFCLPGVRFSAILAFGISGLCLLWLILNRWAVRSRCGRVCKRIFLVSVSAVLALLLILETLVITRSGGDPSAESVDAVVVLGAGVHGEQPSLSLQTRIEAAAAFLADHPDIPAVLSGGQGQGETISEAEAMRRGLSERGIDPSRLLLEDRSTDTEENFSYSFSVLMEHGIDPGTQRIAIVSNDFHLFRAQLLSARTGFTDTVGVSAQLPWLFLSVNYFIREAFASVKTLFL